MSGDTHRPLANGIYGDNRRWQREHPQVLMAERSLEVRLTLRTTDWPGEAFERVQRALEEAGIEVTAGSAGG